MNLKLLWSKLFLLAIGAMFMDGAFAQPFGRSSEWDWKTKFAADYNAGKFRDIIADAAALQKLH